MKMFTKKIVFASLVGLLSLIYIQTNSQVNYLLDNDCANAQLIIYIVPDVNYPSSTDWNPGNFTIEVTDGSTGVLGAVTNTNGFNFSPQNNGSSGGSFYQVFSHAAGNQKALTAGVPFEVARISLLGSMGSFKTFRIPAYDDAWVSILANGAKSIMTANPPGSNQIPTTYGATTVTNIPLFAGIFWDGAAWCGGSQANQEPGLTDGSLNCYINGTGGLITYFNGVVNQLTIATGADLTIGSGFALTANGATHIEDPQSLMITADQFGTGSFIDNGTVTYGVNGSAEVQAYMAHAGNYQYHMHQIGPLVHNPSFALPGVPGQNGVFLQEFDLLQGSTYSYQYLEPTNAWQNIWQLTEPVPTPHGIMLSDVSGVSKTISQIGNLNTGTITTVPAGVGLSWSLSQTTAFGNGCVLLSNPYPSGLNLNTLYANNIIAFNASPTAYIWEHGLSGGTVPNGNYATWNTNTSTGTGAMTGSGGMISPGQGFFGVLGTLWVPGGTPPITYNNIMRVHWHAPFIKNQHVNLFRLKAEGNSSADDLLIYFYEGGSSGFDTLDSYKWESMYEGVTQINSLATTGEKLTQNIMPPLGNQTVSVPVEFYCGAEGEYSLTASDLETFIGGTQIWLEDLAIGGPWQDLLANPVYEFTASPDDPAERFIVHFFGPTGIDDPVAQSAIRIYGYGQDAYIVNRGNETVQEYVAYDMMGRELHRGTLPNSTVNKVTIGNVSAYYIVKVITKEGNVYTDKVFISQ
ncbi:MAG: hypothetical protein K0B08_11790 [Bacteroidales bacterium]|nr:hypothetical protein [Bacteroidales bacterium]